MDDGRGDVPDDPRIIDYEELIGSADAVEFHIDDEQQAAESTELMSRCTPAPASREMT